MAAIIGCAVLSCSQANAQWWPRGPPQAKRGLYLFRFHAKSKLRYRRPQSDDGRAKADRRAICRLSRKSAASKHRGGFCRETAAIAAAGLVNKRGRSRGARDPRYRQAARACKRPSTRQASRLSAAFLLMRMAAAFRKHQGPEKGPVRIFVEQGQAPLTANPTPSLPEHPTEFARPSIAASLASRPRHPGSAPRCGATAERSIHDDRRFR